MDYAKCHQPRFNLLKTHFVAECVGIEKPHCIGYLIPALFHAGHEFLATCQTLTKHVFRGRAIECAARAMYRLLNHDLVCFYVVKIGFV